MTLPDLFARLAAAFFPPRCLLCNNLVPYDEPLCADCRFPHIGQVTLRIEHALAGVLAVAPYSGNARKLVWRIKDGKEPRVYPFFARELRCALQAHWGGVPFDVIVPVPTTAAKRRERGYNQAELLARPLAGLLAIPLCPDALTRADTSETQHNLSDKSRRRQNAADSYLVHHPGAVTGKRVLLLDDLLTTGYTMAACANCLMQAGATAVYAIAAAYTPDKK